MNKLTLFFAPLFTAFVPYLAWAQTNDNYPVCSGGNCPYSQGAGQQGYDYDRYHGMGGFMRDMMGNSVGPWGMHALGWLWLLLVLVFWVLIITGIIYLIKHFVHGGNYYHDYGHTGDKKMWMAKKVKMMKKEDNAIAILKERYAKGEIDKKEYREKMNELED